MVTLRDRTELQSVTGELDVVRGLTESLRAQNHEAANRLHAVVSLIETGHSERAVEFATEELRVAQELADQVMGAVQEPVLAALLLGKTAEAAERGIDLVVGGEVVPEELPLQPRELVTVLGNLVDNAMDAVAESARRRIVVHVEGRRRGPVRRGGGQRHRGPARGRGAGPGARLVDQGQRRSRIGLALVGQVVRQHGGTVVSTTRTSAARASPSPSRGAPGERALGRAGARRGGRGAGRGGPRGVRPPGRRLRARRRGTLRRGGAATPGQRPGRPGAAGHAPARRPRPGAAAPAARGRAPLRRDRGDVGARHRRGAPRGDPGGGALPAQAVLVRDVPLQARALRGVPAPAGGHRRRRGPGRGGPGLRRAAQPLGGRRAAQGPRCGDPAPGHRRAPGRRPGTGLSATEVGAAVGASRVTARRYLEHLADQGQVERSPRYGGGGRPEVAYRWRR